MSNISNPTAYKMLIGGEWVDAEDDKRFESVDPATGSVWAMFPRAKAADADKAVLAADKAFNGTWGLMSPQRAG
jgi:aldehyde dehydrogenase (NAD+)